MLGAITDGLTFLGAHRVSIAWVVLGAFLAGVIAEQFDERWATRIYSGAWVVLAVYWLAFVRYFVIEQKSITESIGVLLAIPLTLYVSYLLINGRTQLFVISRAVAFGWMFYLPITSLTIIRRPLMEMVTAHTEFILHLLGDQFLVGDWYPYIPEGLVLADGSNLAFDAVLSKKHYPYRTTFLYVFEGRPISYTIRMACTGVGSMSIFVGLIGAVRGSIRQKAKALGVAMGVIYVLNIARNVFIAYTLGNQSLHIFPNTIMSLFSANDPYQVSYFLGDRIIAQFLSVFALMGIIWLVILWVPDVFRILEEGMYVVTGDEYDLKDAIVDEPDMERL